MTELFVVVIKLLAIFIQWLAIYLAVLIKGKHNCLYVVISQGTK